MSGFTVAIVGRPNVGKSTLFNRLIEQRKAIVDNISGVTRDRQYGVCEWNGRKFNVIDTGGFVAKTDDVFEKEIKKQVHIALEEANLVLFVCDTATGITGQDEDMTILLRRSTKPVLLAVNKVDNSERALEATEFYALGFDQTFFISSISGSGTGDLLDEITKHIPIQEEVIEEQREDWNAMVEEGMREGEEWLEGQNFDDLNETLYEEEADLIEEDWEIEEQEEEEGASYDKAPRAQIGLPKIAIIGQPNAGKSTLLNALIGQERTIVSNIPGTTRDSIHTQYKLFGKEFILIDTAGLRKKKNVHEDLEFYSVIRAIKAMDEADICMMIIDAEKGITAQDISIFSLAARKGKGIVIMMNKWDLVEKETNTARDYEAMIKQRIAPFNDVPVIFISATEKQRIFQGIEKALQVFDARNRRIKTSALNDAMLKEIQYYPPPMSRGHAVKIKFATQLPTAFPTFVFFANHPDAIKDAYKKFLENKIRSHFDFNGVPIRIFFRKK